MPIIALTGDLVAGALPALGPGWLQPATLVTSFGGWAIVAVSLFVFAETGLLLGFILPGDTLLFTTGLLTATGAVGTPLWLVCLALVLAAVAGGETGYLVGRKAGRPLLARSRLVSEENLERTEGFVARHGRTALIAARFVPVVRTFAPVVAGAAHMPARAYTVANAAGGALWVLTLTLTGAWLGQVPAVRDFVLVRLDEVVLAVVLVTLLLVVSQLVRRRQAARRERRAAQTAAEAARAEVPEPCRSMR